MFRDGRHGTFQRVLEVIEEWRPADAHRSEVALRRDVESHLEDHLGRSGVGALLGPLGPGHAVETDYGPASADVAVGDAVGVEVTLDLASDETAALHGRIESLREAFPYVVVCGFRVRDASGWRGLCHTFEGDDESAVAFVHRDLEDVADGAGASGGVDSGSLFGDRSF